MVPRLAAWDSAARPANAEGNKTSREAVERSACRVRVAKATKAQAVQPIGTDERGKKRTDEERVGQNKLSTLKRKNRKAQARRVSEHQNSPARQPAT
jgi:hypothetical protein